MNISRELIFPRSEQIGDAWELELPACCVVCGVDTDADAQRETRIVDDVGITVLILIAAVPVSLYVWWNYGHWWMLPVLLTAVILGYSFRRTESLDIEFCRCEKHRDQRKYPEVFLIGEGLLVRVGQRRVKKEYRKLPEGGPTPFTPPEPPAE